MQPNENIQLNSIKTFLTVFGGVFVYECVFLFWEANFFFRFFYNNFIDDIVHTYIAHFWNG